ncbi:molybdopterin molybdotransferase MoeA [Sulfitobacter mediterraneus]|uniref:molybdopterin molybdotransferase MoeA n=1 Tax=Sulfitobacter mediterraneus TaxID=83219 RepID=UPI001933FD46|nr:gephyrin-like molybdotransferase Glp [Sulfitobacter mediterraneus]MBM1309214.1 molybdopterin molybdotransferase MoeA [Sulfitobacter mediterraneus]MBM1313099.1 molybdopterin molybdotransferase MoeA [Sulfitobacter mediterraneus]MBM1321483.1 molybdopterin molybdotransferase MoeA [Sulfitobacter mediterraneus]MBM1325370.1 molybdopterin molybdotransferase MoeA [Sulfitobacter mediterraneus]MBM1396716.1 molybdopterin molybdotransferase MoeA [Sulfitobacter mediterraneus]
MIPVAEALQQVLDLVAPLEVEEVPLRQAAGRVLARDVTATRTQPPFAASSMDGYALRRAEVEPDAMFKVVGEAAAGHRFEGKLKAGQAVRIFTGAPIPDGADFVVIQEDTTRRGDLITLGHKIGQKDNIRPAGGDFAKGQKISAPLLLRPADIALLAAMNIARVPVARKPIIAILATGDELVQPGETPAEDQIVASNSFGLAAMFEGKGANVRMLPVARDNAASLKQAFTLAKGADLIITIGGASVGDHDLVAPVAAEIGMEQSFYKVAMRPGKPLMAGRLGEAVMLGLPGNPVSAMVCGTVFGLPLLRKMLGLGSEPLPMHEAPLGVDLPQNGPRTHYMRAHLRDGQLFPDDRQDSSLLSVLATANALMVRPVDDAPRKAGDTAYFIAI